MPTQWMGETTCNLCRKPIEGHLYDAKLRAGHSWATLCQRCFSRHGIGLGTGYGQEYAERKEDDKTIWVKTSG
jgi:hypothetical protein